MLKQRIITALILLPIAFIGFFYLQGGWFSLFFGIVTCIGAWEWAQLAGFSSDKHRYEYAALMGLALVILYLLPQLAPFVMLAAIIWWIAALFMVCTYPATMNKWSNPWHQLWLGFLILLPAWQGLVSLKQWPYGEVMIFVLMLLVWSSDIGAYFWGRRYGRRKLALAVSPGKTVEGAYGGLASALLCTFLIAYFFDWGTRTLLLALLATVIVTGASIVGDLTESMFKRRVGIKDSSNLLPGHGGVLDRIDSLTAAVPVFTTLLWWYGWGSL